MRRLTTTLDADNDIRDIATYIAFDNVAAASQFGVELAAALNRIAASPAIGRPLSGYAFPFVRCGCPAAFTATSSTIAWSRRRASKLCAFFTVLEM